jgi:hypothetical protein
MLFLLHFSILLFYNLFDGTVNLKVPYVELKSV